MTRVKSTLCYQVGLMDTVATHLLRRTFCITTPCKIDVMPAWYCWLPQLVLLSFFLDCVLLSWVEPSKLHHYISILVCFNCNYHRYFQLCLKRVFNHEHWPDALMPLLGLASGLPWSASCSLSGFFPLVWRINQVCILCGALKKDG